MNFTSARVPQSNGDSNTSYFYIPWAQRISDTAAMWWSRLGLYLFILKKKYYFDLVAYIFCIMIPN